MGSIDHCGRFMFAAISLMLYCTASYLCNAYRSPRHLLILLDIFLIEIVTSSLDRFMRNPCYRDLHCITG